MQLWQLSNNTPFAAHARFLRDHTSATHWCVWIKANFLVDQDGKVIWQKDIRSDLLITPHTTEIEGNSIILQESDLVLEKSATDITLSGYAVCPPASDPPFLVSVSVDQWQKILQVNSHKVWRRMRGSQTLKQMHKEKIHIGWQNTFGGSVKSDDKEFVFEENPIGKGFVAEGDLPDEVVMPCLSYPGEDHARPSRSGRPASLLPVPKSWMPRRSFAGTYDQKWSKLRSPILPKDFNTEFYHSTTADQRFHGYIAGGEVVRLKNIHWHNEASAPPFKLPHFVFNVKIRFDGEWIDMTMKAHSLHIEPSEAKFSLTWGGSMPIGAISNDIKVQETAIALNEAQGFEATSENFSNPFEELTD